MDQCLQALNRGVQPMPSALNLLSIPALSPDSCDASACAPAPAYQNHTESRLPFVRFTWKNASPVRKAFSRVRLCPFRAINKLKTNNLWERLYADCLITSLANIKLSSSRLALRKTTPLGALPFPSLLDARQKWLCLRALSGRPPKYTRRGEPPGRPQVTTKSGQVQPGDGVEKSDGFHRVPEKPCRGDLESPANAPRQMIFSHG